MEFQSIKLVCFSPTGTTKAVIQGIAQGFGPGTAELIDITRPEVRARQLETTEQDLLVVGVPVYIGRVPEMAMEWLKTIKASNTPAVCVVVYGNRDYDDALIELRDRLAEQGCVPVAGAAYIGEHSFSGADTPVAVGRPDEKDISHGEAFGKKVKEYLAERAFIDGISLLPVPGQQPYRGDTKTWKIHFTATSEACTQCGTCGKVCPAEAIDKKDSRSVDKEKCILCCACIKNCPQQAKSMVPSPVKDAAVRLHTLCQARKEPVIFI